MRSLRHIPYFLFLLPVFFCLHGWMENYGLLEGQELLIIGGTIMVCLLLFSGLLWLFYKRQYLPAALVTFFIGLWYLFFGAIVDWLNRIPALSFLSPYSRLVPLLLLLTLCWILLMRKRKALQLKLLFFFNCLMLIYCCIDIVTLVGKSGKKVKPDITSRILFDTAKVTAKPNVYLLVFDEYAGRKSLQDSFHFNNDSLYHYLGNKGFRELPLFANYDFTLFSMSSILNMNYIDSNYRPDAVVERDIQLRTIEIRHAAVFELFSSMGYTIHNYSIFDIGRQPGIDKRNSFLPVHSRLLTDKILHNRMMRTSGWLLRTKKLGIASLRKNILYKHDVNNIKMEEKIMAGSSAKRTAPGFFISHFVLPHWPYYRDSTGKYLHDSIISKAANIRDRKLYISYLKYTNTVIYRLADSITMNDPGAIVIIMSDHGYREYAVKNTDPANFDNICLVRLPGNNYPPYKEHWSGVNLFRYIFNAGFGQNIPYLRDTSLVLRYK